MRPGAPITLFFAFAGSALLALPACDKILNVGGITIERTPPAALVPPDGGLACGENELHCEGVALQICRPDRAGFRTVRVCSTPELCCDGEHCGTVQGCLPPTCAPGDFRCDGVTLSICNDAQTGWTKIDECATGPQCNATRGRCTDVPCDSVTRESQCNGAERELCQPLGWRVSETCLTHSLCSGAPDATNCATTGCIIDSNLPSPFQCTYGDLMRCNDEQTGFEHMETCLNPANCNPLITELAGDPYAVGLPPQVLQELGCQAPGCTPGRYRCESDGRLMQCNPNRTGYIDRVDTCTSAAHCNAAEGRCEPAPCIVNSTQCSGDEYQRCAASGWQVEAVCQNGAPCEHESGCKEPLCDATEYRCSGTQLLRCNVNRTGWIPVRTCDTEALCNVAAKRCDQPVCTPGERRCSRGSQLEECSPGRDAWRQVEDCRAALGAPADANLSASCDLSGSGQCLLQPSCAPDTLRCNGQFLERCRNDAWVPFERCASAALCDAVGTGSCLEPTCQSGTYRCVESLANPVPALPSSPTRGLILQRCNMGGTGYELVRACAAEEFCDAGHGQCDICNPGEPGLCSGNELLVCTADGQERTLQKVCPAGCIIEEPSGRAACLGDVQLGN